MLDCEDAFCIYFYKEVIKVNSIVRGMNNFFVSKFIGSDATAGSLMDPQLRKKYAFLEAWISIAGNFILAIVKLFFGFMLNSISLIADAVHTASDVLTSAVVIVGFKLSSIPADEKHPHGHGRIEFIATLVIAILLIVVGVEFGISSYHRFISNTAVKGSFLVAFLMVLAAIVKELMSMMSIDLGERIKSSALIADAWHHRTDAVASLLVAVAILASKYGYFKVDAVLGFVVSALIIYTGVEIFLEATSKLIGEIDQEEVEYVNYMAMSVEDVKGIHDVSIHDYGASKEISLHIEVDKDLTLKKAHDIAQNVESLIESNVRAVVTVHVDSMETQ